MIADRVAFHRPACLDITRDRDVGEVVRTETRVILEERRLEIPEPVDGPEGIRGIGNAAEGRDGVFLVRPECGRGARQELEASELRRLDARGSGRVKVECVHGSRQIEDVEREGLSQYPLQKRESIALNRAE